MNANRVSPLQVAQPNERRALGKAALRLASIVLAVGSALTACHRNVDSTATNAPREASVANTAPSASATRQSSQGSYALGIVGYNYTEVGIVDYSVNGTGAFNLAVSNGDAGGGKTACCFSWAPAAKLPMPMRIEWTRDEKTWCRETVMLTEARPLEPTTLEVHFYPDRHIEVAITDMYSVARVRLGRAGRDFRVGSDVRQELSDAIQRDAKVAECRAGRFPIGGSS